MYDICHPSYYYIGNLGCNDPIKISTAFYVYMELCEAKRFWHVDYKYNQELDLLYLEAKQNKHSNLEIYLPWPVSYTITLDKIENIQRLLQSERLIFIFKSEDSNSVTYRVTSGLVKPSCPEITKKLKDIEDKKLLLQGEIKKNTAYLYELAKSLKSSDNENQSTSDAIDIDTSLKLIESFKPSLKKNNSTENCDDNNKSQTDMTDAKKNSSD